jgi:hypothetical protein
LHADGFFGSGVRRLYAISIAAASAEADGQWPREAEGTWE